MATHSLKQINVKTGSKTLKIYPEKLKENGELHSSVGIKLSRQQAVELATSLLVGASTWEEMHLTAFRNRNTVTVTSQQPE